MLKRSACFILLAATSCLAACTEGSAASNTTEGSDFSPKLFDRTLVLMASNTLDPNATPSDPRIKRLQYMPFMIDGTYLTYPDTLDLSKQEIDLHEGKARALLKSRFGIDLDSPDTKGRIWHGLITVSPEVDYRVYAMSGRSVPAEGWKLYDTLWATFVVDPNGFTLGGEYDGMHVPLGTALPYGVYYIKADPEPIAIPYNAIDPLIPGPAGEGPINCEAHHPDYGEGLTLGMSTQVPRKDGLIDVSLRAVLSFPAHAASRHP